MAAVVANTLRAEGVALHLGAAVQAVEEREGRAAVVLRDASGLPQLLSAEALLVAMGRTPNVAGLDLEKAGVACDAKGVGVDARLRTSRPHIFAAGDVLGVWQFTHAAGYEAGVALANAVMRLPRKADYSRMPRAAFCEPELAGLGLTEKAATAAGIEYTVHVQTFADNDRARAEGATEGLAKMLVDPRGRVLGVHICGQSAGELLNEWVAILSGGVRLSTLAQAVHPYPTMGEIHKRLAGEYLAPRIFNGLFPKALKALFGLKGRACGGPPER